LSDNIISYVEMCRREGSSLQQGMNFGIGDNHSVILMSVRRNAPYRDRLEDGGTTLVYEGHDQPKGPTYPNPKSWINQSDSFPVASRRTVNSTRLLDNINVGSARQNECEFTKRSSQGFGLITGSFI
jgi:hypothetical protein